MVDGKWFKNRVIKVPLKSKMALAVISQNWESVLFIISEFNATLKVFIFKFVYKFLENKIRAFVNVFKTSIKFQ